MYITYIPRCLSAYVTHSMCHMRTQTDMTMGYWGISVYFPAYDGTLKCALTPVFCLFVRYTSLSAGVNHQFWGQQTQYRLLPKVTDYTTLIRHTQTHTAATAAAQNMHKNRGEICAQLWKTYTYTALICVYKQALFTHQGSVPVSTCQTVTGQTVSRLVWVTDVKIPSPFIGIVNGMATHTHIVHVYFHFLFLNHSDVWSRITIQAIMSDFFKKFPITFKSFP